MAENNQYNSSVRRWKWENRMTSIVEICNGGKEISGRTYFGKREVETEKINQTTRGCERFMGDDTLYQLMILTKPMVLLSAFDSIFILTLIQQTVCIL
jgi:hypothetical protein